MKKVIGLFLVILLSTVTVFAQKEKRKGNKGGDPSERIEKVIADLKLDEKQAADFRKIHEDFRAKMQKERESAKEDREQMREKMKSMREEMNADMKKVLSEEQYKQYQEKMERQRPDGPRKGDKRK